MKARKLIFLIVCFIIVLSSNVHARVSFAYDEAGNRVRREIVINRGSRAMDKSESKDEAYFDVLGDRMIKVTQNESGIVKVTVLDMVSDDECYIDVCSIDGMQVFTEPHAGVETVIDLSTRAKGIYILRVVVNETQTTWKITKP